MRCKLRNVEAVPVLDRLDVYLTQLASYVLPKSALAKAVTYARNQWEALRCYTKDGRLTIDNNVSERTLRHQAIGQELAISRQPSCGSASGRAVHDPGRRKAASH